MERLRRLRVYRSSVASSFDPNPRLFGATMKYVVGFSLSTLATFTIVVGLAVSTLCLTLIICSYHPAEPAIVRPIVPRKVTAPIQLQPQGSVGTAKEARLEAQFGPVDTSKTHERKEGFFDRFRRPQQVNYVSRVVVRQACPNCSQVSRPSQVYVQPKPEPMPDIDPASYADGSVALRTKDVFQLTSPLVSPPTCPNCPKAQTIFGN